MLKYLIMVPSQYKFFAIKKDIYVITGWITKIVPVFTKYGPRQRYSQYIAPNKTHLLIRNFEVLEPSLSFQYVLCINFQ